jgi:hypothetical protein
MLSLDIASPYVEVSEAFIGTTASQSDAIVEYILSWRKASLAANSSAVIKETSLEVGVLVAALLPAISPA